MSNYVPLGRGPSAEKNLGGEIFSHPLRVRGVVQTFSGNSPWKGVPKTGFKILRAPPPQKKNLRGIKISPNFAISRLFRPFLQNGARYHQSKNWFVIYGHSSTRWQKRVYFGQPQITRLNLENTHPPISLLVFIQRDSLGGNWAEVFQFDTVASK